MPESGFIPYATSADLPSGPVLVLAPHPDDEVIGCGGALRRHVEQGDCVTVAIATDGTGARCHDSSVSQAQYSLLRQQESRCAAEILGYGDVRIWPAQDRALASWPHLDKQLLELVAEIDPRVVYVPSLYEIHPDHHALALAVCRAAPRLEPGLQVMFYEIGWPVPPNVLVDISAQLERKRAALRCFVSQLSIQDYLRHMEGLNVYRTYTLPPNVLAAEAYLCAPAGALAADPMTAFGRSRLTDALNAQPF